MTVRTGTSGWPCPGWRGGRYPGCLVHRRELNYLAARLNSVELNGSFYSPQRPSSYLSRFRKPRKTSCSTLFGAIPDPVMLRAFAGAGVDRCLLPLRHTPEAIDTLDRWAGLS